MKNHYELKEGKDILGMARAVRECLRKEHMEARLVCLSGEKCFVQGYAPGENVRRMIGMDKEISVKLEKEGERQVTMEIRSGRWVNKGIALGISLSVCRILTPAPVYGICSLGMLPARIRRAAEDYLKEEGRLL